MCSTNMDNEEYDYCNMLDEVVEEWNESEIRSLITYVKANDFLINQTEKDFWNKGKRDDAWKIIVMLLNKTEIEVQKKWRSLRTVFCRKLAQLKQKMPSGSGANVKGQSFQIAWEYWGDMQFLIPHTRHKANRTSNFEKKLLPLSTITSGSLISPTNAGKSVLKSAKETYEDTAACTVIESLASQNTDIILPATSSSTLFLTETIDNEISASLSSEDFSCFETLSTNNSEQKLSMPTNKIENKGHSSSIKRKCKVPAPDRFHTKKKKELEFCTARMSETSQCIKETLNAVTQSLKEPSGSDDLQYFACLLPIFKQLNDNQKTECLKALLNVMIEFGSKN